MRLTRKKILVMVGLVMSIFLASGALADQVGYEFKIYGSDPNVPFIELKNLSMSAEITEFTVTIGDEDYNFDKIYNTVPGGIDTVHLVAPDSADGHDRSDSIQLTFSGFDPNEILEFRTDIDKDNANTNEDYRTVMFNNGSAPNSVLTVVFSSGSTLSGTLPDYSGAAPYIYSQVVPLPPSVLLLGSSLLGLMGIRRLRKG